MIGWAYLDTAPERGCAESQPQHSLSKAAVRWRDAWVFSVAAAGAPHTAALLSVVFRGSVKMRPFGLGRLWTLGVGL